MMMARRLTLAALIGAGLLATALLASEAHADVRNRPSSSQLAEVEREALDLLGQVALDTKASEPTRLDAVRALLDYGNADAVPTLTEILSSTPTPTVRRAVADGLVRFRGSEVTAALRTAASQDDIARIRWRAGLTLIRRDAGQLDVIEGLLSDDATLAAAAVDLQQAQTVAMLPESARALAREAFRAHLDERDAFNEVERAAMIKAVGQLDVRDAASQIEAILSDASEDPFIRGAAAFSLGLLGADGTVPALLNALNAGEAGLQSSAAGALGRIAPRNAQAPLERLLTTSESAEVRAAAAEALRAYGADVLPLLEDALASDPSLAVREAALNALTTIGGADAARAVAEFARSEFLQTCNPMSCGSLAFGTLEALVALGRTEAAIDGLQGALERLRPQLPLLFAFASDSLISVATVILDARPETLTIFINDEDAFVQAIGLFAWANVADGPEARKVFTRFTDTEQSALVRRAALEGLVQWALPRDVPVFLDATSSDDRRTRAAAYRGLARVGDNRALQAFQEGLNSADAAVRIQAAGAGMGWANRFEALNKLEDPVF